MPTSFSDILAEYPPTSDSQKDLESLAMKRDLDVVSQCRGVSALVWAVRNIGDEWTSRHASKAIRVLAIQYESLRSSDAIHDVCTVIAASVHLLLALCATTTGGSSKEVGVKKRARQSVHSP